MSSARKQGFEPWAWLAFVLAGATAALILFLGSRPGGRVAVLAYRLGPLYLGTASAVLLLVGLIWSLRRRPVLQRGRAWPLFLLGACLWFCSQPIAYPSSHEGKYSTTRFRLPFEGTAKVQCGGERRATNPLLFDPSRRFGLCFLPGSSAPLVAVAPAAGRVLRLEDGRAGRRLVLETGAQEYCVLEGLEIGPDVPEAGGWVEAGAAVGRATLLFVHLQDDPQPGRGEGIPMRFWNYRVDGREVEAGVPIPPQEIASEAVGPAPAAGGR